MKIYACCFFNKETCDDHDIHHSSLLNAQNQKGIKDDYENGSI